MGDEIATAEEIQDFIESKINNKSNKKRAN